MENQNWGSSYIDELAKFISMKCPEIKGFNRRGLYRMKQFYETYKDNEFVSPLLTQISWTNHLLILSSTKSIEEKEFSNKRFRFMIVDHKIVWHGGIDIFGGSYDDNSLIRI